MPTPHLPAPPAFRLLPFLRRTVPQEAAPVLAPSLSVGPHLVSTPANRNTQAAAMLRLSPAAALAHDARGTVTSLQLLAGLIAAPGVLESRFSGYAADLHALTVVLKSLVDQIDVLDRPDVRKQPGRRPAQPPGPLSSAAHARPLSSHAPSASQALESSGRLLQAVAGSSVAVHISSESSLPPLALDDESLARVLMNLVQNAGEAMPGGGAVRITARRALNRQSPAVLLHVCDNGPGIPAHALGRIFEPGFTSKVCTGSAEHGGLGLAIVRELIEAVGGEVRVASTRRRGTTFELRIPCLKTSQSGA